MAAVLLAACGDDGAGPVDGAPPLPDAAPLAACGTLAAIEPLTPFSTTWTAAGTVSSGPFILMAFDGQDAQFQTRSAYDARAGVLEIDFTIMDVANGTFSLIVDDAAGHAFAIELRDADIGEATLDAFTWTPGPSEARHVRAGTLSVAVSKGSLLLRLEPDDGAPYVAAFPAPAWIERARVTLLGSRGIVTTRIDAVRATGDGARACLASELVDSLIDPAPHRWTAIGDACTQSTPGDGLHLGACVLSSRMKVDLAPVVVRVGEPTAGVSAGLRIRDELSDRYVAVLRRGGNVVSARAGLLGQPDDVSVDAVAPRGDAWLRLRPDVDGTFVWELRAVDVDTWTEVARTPMPQLVTTGLAVELVVDGAAAVTFAHLGNGLESSI